MFSNKSLCNVKAWCSPANNQLNRVSEYSIQPQGQCYCCEEQKKEAVQIQSAACIFDLLSVQHGNLISAHSGELRIAVFSK